MAAGVNAIKYELVDAPTFNWIVLSSARDPIAEICDTVEHCLLFHPTLRPHVKIEGLFAKSVEWDLIELKTLRAPSDEDARERKPA